MFLQINYVIELFIKSLRVKIKMSLSKSSKFVFKHFLYTRRHFSSQKLSDVYIVSCARTPLGSFQGELFFLNEIICEGNNCNIQLNNTIVYRNSDHLNTSGAMLLGKEYLSKKNNPLKALNKTK